MAYRRNISARSRLQIVTTLLGPAILMLGCDTSGLLPFDGSTTAAGDGFENATPLTLNADGNLTFSKTLGDSEVDVYDLGPVAPGDRIIVSVEPSAGSTLDPVTAIFDANGELFALNDDVDLQAGRFGSAIDAVVAEPSGTFFLAITKFFFDTQGGAYDVTVRIERGGPLPAPATQVLLLSFQGGTASIQGEGTINVDPFDAADIDAAYAGKTAEIKDRIIEVVRENFANTGLLIFTTDDNPNLAPGTFSTIHFGAFSPTKFGAADNVDQGNRDRCDDGIVFTNEFDDPFAEQPTADGIAVAIGNVASHEAGHLLGLSHVADITALMDSTGTASTLLADQAFKTAPLTRTIFPLGMQNAALLLDRVIPKP